MDALQNSRPVRQRQPKSLPSRQGRKRERQISPSSRQDVRQPQARKEPRHRRGRQRDRQQTEARRQDARKEAMTAVRIPEELPEIARIARRETARSREAAHRGIARIARREAARSREAVHREIARIVRKATEEISTDVIAYIPRSGDIQRAEAGGGTVFECLEDSPMRAVYEDLAGRVLDLTHDEKGEQQVC